MQVKVKNDGFIKIERALSSARLKGYQTNYAKKINVDVIKLYRWNIVLSEALYPVLHVIEIGLRNAIFNAVEKRYANSNWLLTGELLNPIEAKEIYKQVQYLKRIGKLDQNHLIAELNFGFWCAMLDRRYEHNQVLWPILLKDVFPFLKNRKIHIIRKRFNRIRRLRNRVYHYEPIWHWKDLLQQYNEIIEAVSWIEPSLLKLIEINRFLELYHSGPR